MDWVGEFFAALPEVFRALWEFGAGWQGLAVSIGSVVLVAVLTAGALRLRDELGWVAAFLGAFAAFIAGFWLFAILPSAWVFFADGERLLLEGTVIPSELVVGDLDVATNLYEVIRDSVVMAETFLAIAFLAFLTVWIQKRFPRALAPGEAPRSSSHDQQRVPAEPT